MNKIYAIIHCGKNGEVYEARVTDGKFVDVIPVSNSTVEKVKKTLRELYNVSDIWVSREVESE